MPSLPFRRRGALRQQLAHLTEENQRLSGVVGEILEDRSSLPTTRLSSLGTGSKGSNSGFGKVKKGVVLYETYKAIPWISAPIDVIAHRMTSGGIELEPAYKGASAQHKQDILDVLLYMNDEEDVVEDLTISVQDLFIFAESFWEIGFTGKQPNELYYIDPVGMYADRDKRGNLTGYHQETGPGQKTQFTPEQIIHFRKRGPRGLVLSPLEKLLTSSLTYNHMVNWWTHFFENGAKAPFALHLGEKTTIDQVDAALQKYEELYAGAANAHKALVTWGSTSVQELHTSGAVEFDFLQSAKFLREQMLAVLGVPPAEAGVTDDGNRLSDISHAADKRFRNNTIDPHRRLVEEKLTFALVQRGFGYDDWVIRLKEADYEDDELLVNLVVQKVNAGLISRDEGRSKLGEPGNVPGGGGDKPSITLTREVVPVSDLETIHGSQYTAAQQAAATSGMSPSADPEDLAAQSPQSPGQSAAPPASGAAPASDGGPPVDKTVNKSPDKTAGTGETAADLTRWQRIALRNLSDGRPSRAFLSEHIDPVTHFAVEQALIGAASEAEIREIFDLAFADVRG